MIMPTLYRVTKEWISVTVQVEKKNFVPAKLNEQGWIQRNMRRWVRPGYYSLTVIKLLPSVLELLISIKNRRNHQFYPKQEFKNTVSMWECLYTTAGSETKVTNKWISVTYCAVDPKNVVQTKLNEKRWIQLNVRTWCYTLTDLQCKEPSAAVIPGRLVPIATMAMAVTESLRPTEHPKWDATSPIIAVIAPMPVREPTKHNHPLQ